MEFRLHCLVLQHQSARVTLLPVELPRFTLHGINLAKAQEEVRLAVDDTIGRSHPRLLGEFPHARPMKAITLSVDVLPVWNPSKPEKRQLLLRALVMPAHAGFVEVLVPLLHLRVWLKEGASLQADAEALVTAHLKGHDDTALLALRPEGSQDVMTLAVDAPVTLLSSLKDGDLHRDLRPHPHEETEEEPAGEVSHHDGERPPEDTPQEEWDLHTRNRFATPTLDRLGVALHTLAREGMLQRAWEVDAHVDALRVRLETARPEPVVLVGAPGVGKTAWVHELACRWTLEKVAARKRVRPFFTVDGPRLIAGNGFSGAWQEQALAVLREAHHAGAILDLGRAADLLNAGKHAFSEQNVAQLITPLLAQRHVALVAEATPEEWARVERLNQSFARLWTVVRVEEPADGQALKILTRVARDLADDHELALRDGCVEAAFGLSRRFWPYGSTLGNTVSFLRRLVASRRHAGATVLDAGAAVDHFSQESGVPVMLLRDEVPLKTGAVSSFLAQRVLGQELAVERCAQVVGLIKAGLTDRKRPMAVLLFSGPTGVGKTQLAKALTEFVFSSPERMVRLDMGEYSGPDALERLLGSGHGAGHLTSAVRRQPFCLLLLDEIEKAHPAVFDALLGVLGEGRLTDVNGAFTDFRNAIIIMTSNLGAGTLRSRVGFAAAGQDGASAYQDMRRHYVAEAERFFRPEFFNRLDDLVVFSSLERSQLDGVLTRELALLATREGLRKNQLALDVTPAAHEHLLQQGLDPRFGARPLKRAIERELVVPVAGFLASHPGMRASRLQVDAAQGTLTLDGRTTGATDHANIRTLTQDMLERASDIRSRVGALRACGLAQRLNDARQFYEKASKQPAFWNERELAEQKTRQHAEARAMLDRLIALQGQAETLEDLAFEAFYDRAADAVKQLSDDVVALERDVLPVTEDLLACMHNPRFRVRLIMTAGRGAWRHMLKLAEGYRLWAGRRELSVTSHVLSETVSTEKDARTGRSTSTRSVRWQQKAWDPAGPVPVAVSMAFAGKPSRFLLAAEHGNHVVLEGGQSTWVKVKVEMVAAHAALPDEAELAERWTCPDIRRVERDKERVKDLSLGTVATMVSGVIRDLDVLLHPWMFQQLGAPEAEPWT